MLLAVTSDRAEEVADVARRMYKGKRFFASYLVASMMLDHLAAFRQRGAKESQRYWPRTWIDALVCGLAQTWMGVDQTVAKDLEERARHTRANGYLWLADELERVARGRMEGSLLALFGNKPGWELALEAMRDAVLGTASPRGATRSKKQDAPLWWTIAIHPHSHWVDVDAYVASSADAKGTRVSLHTLIADAGAGPALDEHDRRVVEALTTLHRTAVSFSPYSMLSPLIGHPRVRDPLGRHLSVEAAEIKLRVETTSAGARIHLSPSSCDDSGAAIERDGDRVLVYAPSPTRRSTRQQPRRSERRSRNPASRRRRSGLGSRSPACRLSMRGASRRALRSEPSAGSARVRMRPAG